MALEVRIDFDTISDWIAGVVGIKGKVTRDALNWIRWWIEDTMYEEAPVGLTGELRDSIKSYVEGEEIVVRPEIWYAYYVHEGTDPSPGRYIPALQSERSTYPGARLVEGKQLKIEETVRGGVSVIRGILDIGIHPGTPKNPFVERTFNRLIEELDDFLGEYADSLIGVGTKRYG